MNAGAKRLTGSCAVLAERFEASIVGVPLIRDLESIRGHQLFLRQIAAGLSVMSSGVRISTSAALWRRHVPHRT
jgi:hypothetical protein